MIHLDTSFLIRAGAVSTPEDRLSRRWTANGRVARVSSITWAEFLCGPVSAQAAEDAAELFGEPVPFTAADATLAAYLFNAAGRRRGTLSDCMIAAIAMNAGAALATSNRVDFERFAPAGLVLATR